MMRTIAVVAASVALFTLSLTLDLDAQAPGPACRITGTVTSNRTPLPGVAIVVRAGETVAGVTSTALDGRYELQIPAGAYSLSADLTGFTRAERGVDGCPQAVDLELTLAPRTAAPSATPAPAAAPAVRGFETLNVAPQADSAAAAIADADDAPETPLALPPGFSMEASDAVAVNGNVASIDRGQLNDRLDALARGDFGGPPAEVAGGFIGGQEFGGGGGPGGGGGRAGGPGGGGPAGRAGGPGGRGFAGRGAGQGRRVFTFNSGYTMGGSALDASPYELRPGTARPDPDYLRQTFDFSAGGPLWIPKIYDGTGRTTFNVNYSRNQGETLFDQYATVPTLEMRRGDFSTSQRTLVDPETGQPFANNIIPTQRFDPVAAALLQYIPEPNLPGTSRNFRTVTTTDTVSDSVSIRLNHNLTPGVSRGGRGGGAAGARGGGARGGGAGPRGAAAQRWSATINTQLQYRRNDGERNNVFPTLTGHNAGSSLTVPVNLNMMRGRLQHAFSVNFSRTRSETANQYANVTDVAGLAGIRGVSTDPFAWGVPSLSFASLSSVNDVSPSERSDSRFTARYTWTRPLARHTFRAGAEARRDVASSRTDSNARGSFVFTGLYSGSDFADFLLGAPQQASVAYGPGDVELHGRAMSFFIQDDWRRSARLTFNLGLRYELTLPLVEGNGHLVNLDAAPDFSAVTPVEAGGIGQYSGRFPNALVRTDSNNLAPRIGVAWRAPRGVVVRGGYGVSYNAGTYSQIARQLASQPPYAVTETAIAAADEPLPIANAFAAAAAASTTNNFGVTPEYQLGVVQTWNVDVQKEVTRNWSAGGGYTFAAGSSLDLVRAPNRGPNGLRLPDVQPFTWQTSESSSRLHSATMRLRRREVGGIGGGLTYTLARSRDNASTIGGGSTVVAQDDRNLDAEWGLSSFDRRHQLQGNVRIQLPFGPNRRWLEDAGIWTKLLEMWTANVTFAIQSGTPLTPRVLSSSRDVARGTNGTLRADYNGDDISVDNATIDRFFNTAAFSLPASGSFGTAGRNLIIGPGSKDLNATLSRDIRLPAAKTLSIQVRANNLLNMVNYAAVDTVVNSPSFGQVTSVRPMRSVQLSLRFSF